MSFVTTLFEQVFRHRPAVAQQFVGRFIQFRSSEVEVGDDALDIVMGEGVAPVGFYGPVVVFTRLFQHRDDLGAHFFALHLVLSLSLGQDESGCKSGPDTQESAENHAEDGGTDTFHVGSVDGCFPFNIIAQFIKKVNILPGEFNPEVHHCIKLAVYGIYPFNH